MTEQIKILTYFPEKFDPNFLLYRSDLKDFFTVGGTFDNPVFNKIGAGADTHEFTNIEIWLALDNLAENRIVTIYVDNIGLALSKFTILVDDVVVRSFSEETSSSLIVKVTDKLEIKSSAGMDITGITYNQQKTLSGVLTVRGMFMSKDGVNLIVDNNDGHIHNFILSTPYDISSAGVAQGDLDATAKLTRADGVTMKPDGTELFIGNIDSGVAHNYTLTTPYDMNTATFTKSAALGVNTGFEFTDDGLTMFILDINDQLRQYPLTTAWDIATLGTLVYTLSLTSRDNIMEGFVMSEDGFAFICNGRQNTKIYEFKMTQRYTISTAVFVQDFSVAVNVASPEAIAIGKTVPPKLYLISGTGDDVDQYDLVNPTLGSSFASII